MAKNTLVCTNGCGIRITYDPGAAGNKCPKCGNGGIVSEDSEMVP